MAIEKQMGDAAAGIAVANSTKGLLPSSLTVTYLAAPRDTSLLRRSSLLVVLQHKKEEAFIGWMSSAALMAVEQKRPEMGGVRYSRYSSQEPPCLDQLQNGSQQQRQYIVVVVSATKAKKGCFLLRRPQLIAGPPGSPHQPRLPSLYVHTTTLSKSRSRLEVEKQLRLV